MHCLTHERESCIEQLIGGPGTVAESLTELLKLSPSRRRPSGDDGRGSSCRPRGGVAVTAKITQKQNTKSYIQQRQYKGTGGREKQMKPAQRANSSERGRTKDRDEDPERRNGVPI